MKQQSIKDFINTLVGKPFLRVGRASNLVWFGFGEEIEEIDIDGNRVVKSSLALHLQCPWRMVNEEQNQVLFASNDIYVPNTSTEWTTDFNWDIHGINLFDEKTKTWVAANSNLHVLKISYLHGDLKVSFSNRNCLDVFINSTSDEECWRLLNYKKNHLVQTGEKIVIV